MSNLPFNVRAWASRMIDAAGLRKAVFRYREWAISRSDRRMTFEGETIPLPSPYLRTLVAGTPNVEWFLNSGREELERFETLLTSVGGTILDAESVLEWGCGCGRFSRLAAPRVGSGFTGVDINASLIDWCSRHLPGRYLVNSPMPPLPLPADGFDTVFACSVLTHLRETSVTAWLAEIARVMKPTGHALLTFHDEAYPTVTPEVRDQLTRTGFAVRFDQIEGSNHLASYMTADQLAELAAPHMTVVAYVPSGARGNGQAMAVLVRREATTKTA